MQCSTRKNISVILGRSGFIGGAYSTKTSVSLFVGKIPELKKKKKSKSVMLLIVNGQFIYQSTDYLLTCQLLTYLPVNGLLTYLSMAYLFSWHWPIAYLLSWLSDLCLASQQLFNYYHDLPNLMGEGSQDRIP